MKINIIIKVGKFIYCTSRNQTINFMSIVLTTSYLVCVWVSVMSIQINFWVEMTNLSFLPQKPF